MYRKLTILGIVALSLAVVKSSAIAVTVEVNGSGSSDATISPHHVEHHTTGSSQEFVVDQAARPDVPSYRLASFDTDRAVDALMSLPVTAGMEMLPSGKEMKEVAPVPARGCDWFSHPSFYAEYGYVNSLDQRRDGADSHTNSAVVGFDFVTCHDLLVGFTYSFSNRDGHISPIGLPDNEDAHFFSGYLAKSFINWINIGVSGGYGYTSLETQGSDSGHENTWTISPFIGVSHSWGAFSGSLTGSSINTWTGTHDSPTGANSDDETGKIAVTLKFGYAATEKLRFQVSAKYTGTEYHEDQVRGGLPEDYDWATFGGKVSYRITQVVDLYGSYSYDAFNDSYHNHNVQAGILASF
jgi:hypothetical protein